MEVRSCAARFQSIRVCTCIFKDQFPFRVRNRKRIAKVDSCQSNLNFKLVVYKLLSLAGIINDLFISKLLRQIGRDCKNVFKRQLRQVKHALECDVDMDCLAEERDRNVVKVQVLTKCWLLSHRVERSED